MASLYTLASRNVAKTWALMAVFFLLVILLGWGISWYVGSPIILWVAVAVAMVMNLTSYWYSDKIVLAMTGAKEADPAQYRELHRVVENLAITAGLPKPRVYIIDDPSPNAFATGRDPQHAAIAFTTGLLSVLDRAELEGVAAHELAHIRNRDILVATVAVVLAGVVALVADFFLRIALVSDNRSRGAPIMLIAVLVGAVLAPIAAQLLHLAVSRQREYLADASAALLTRYPEGLANALRKISEAARARPLRSASHATAHLFIASPFGDDAPSREKRRGFGNWVASLFSTHPPVEDRIARLLSYGVASQA
ncbi:MAG: protease HtpX [Candidatus Parcubacteria bacterium]|nr:MAG: protease HtpX [Candidatus Parcubacteria bacterium]